MKRRGVALYITIGLITVISIVIMNSFDLIDRGFKHVGNVEKINQSVVILNDIEVVVKSIVSTIDNSDMLYAVLMPFPPIADENGLFVLSIELKSLSKAVNISAIIEDYNASEPDKTLEIKKVSYLSIFEYIFNKYQLRDGQLLLDIILDSLDNDTIERSVGSEIVLTDTSFPNGFIANREHFQRILDEYQEKSDDNDVGKVPWEDFFYFSYNKQETMIDCTFMTRNLAESLDLTIEDVIDFDRDEAENFGSEQISCDMIENGDNKAIKDSLKIKPYDGKESYNIEALVAYSANISEEAFRLIYDLKKKRIVDIEIKELSF